MTSQGTSHLRATIAANLDRAITASGQTNRAIGERIGKTEHQVWRWRTGRHKPGTESLTALAVELFDGDITRFYIEPRGRDAAKAAKKKNKLFEARP